MAFPAFKEWDSVVRFLANGQACLILRKGGIHEGSRLFQILHSAFFLFPTYEHQTPSDLKASALAGFKGSEASARLSGRVRIDCEAVLEKAWWVEDFQKLQAAGGLHAYSPEGAQKKFDWGDRPGLYALLVRVKRLDPALEIPNLAAYGGCRSWVEVEIPAVDAGRPQGKPVLSDEEFSQRALEAGRVFSGCAEVCPGSPE